MNTLILILLMTGTVGLLFGVGAGYLWKAYRGGKGWRNIGKSLYIELPEIPGARATVEWRSLEAGFFDRKSKEPNADRDDEDRIVPAGPACYASNWGPVQVMTSYGANLVAPSQIEAAKTIEAVYVADWISLNKRLPSGDEATKGSFQEGLAKAVADAKVLASRFMVWDPLIYRKKSRESVMQKLYHSLGSAKDPWYAKAAFFAIIICGGLLLILLLVVMMKILPALQQAGGV